MIIKNKYNVIIRSSPFNKSHTTTTAKTTRIRCMIGDIPSGKANEAEFDRRGPWL